jgi:hypothetical protein
VLDEFGAVVATAADQALALLQRGRTHEGQVHVVTQSVADIEALTGQTGLLASMADNFAAFVVHRQSAPESRDWLAKLMGTTALWQSTDQTAGYAASASSASPRTPSPNCESAKRSSTPRWARHHSSARSTPCSCPAATHRASAAPGAARVR